MSARKLTNRETYLEYHRIILDAKNLLDAEAILTGSIASHDGDIDDELVEGIEWVARRVHDATGHWLQPAEPGALAFPTKNTLYFNVFIIQTSWLSYALALPSYSDGATVKYSRNKYQFLQRTHLFHTPRGDESFSRIFLFEFHELVLGTNDTLSMEMLVADPSFIEPRSYPLIAKRRNLSGNDNIEDVEDELHPAPESVNVVQFSDTALSAVPTIGSDFISTLTALETPVSSCAGILRNSIATSKTQAQRDSYHTTDPWSA